MQCGVYNTRANKIYIITAKRPVKDKWKYTMIKSYVIMKSDIISLEGRCDKIKGNH